MAEENDAAAVAYGADKKFEIQPYLVLFLNLGSSNFQATIAKFQVHNQNISDKQGKAAINDLSINIDILSQITDNRISERIIDFDIINIISEHINSFHTKVGGIDIRKNPKVINRILKETLKIKENLLDDKEITINISEIAELKSSKLSIQTSNINQIIEKYTKYIQESIKIALEKGEVKIDQVSTVEVIGKIPRFFKISNAFSKLIGEKQQL